MSQKFSEAEAYGRLDALGIPTATITALRNGLFAASVHADSHLGQNQVIFSRPATADTPGGSYLCDAITLPGGTHFVAVELPDKPYAAGDVFATITLGGAGAWDFCAANSGWTEPQLDSGNNSYSSSITVAALHRLIMQVSGSAEKTLTISGTFAAAHTAVFAVTVTSPAGGSDPVNIYSSQIYDAAALGTVPLFDPATGTLPIANGGTGAATAGAALTNLGATAVGSSLVTAATASAARIALGATTVGNALYTATNEQAARNALLLDRWWMGLDGFVPSVRFCPGAYTSSMIATGGNTGWDATKWFANISATNGSRAVCSTSYFSLVPLGTESVDAGYGSIDWASYTIVAEWIFNFVYCVGASGWNNTNCQAIFCIGPTGGAGPGILGTMGCGFELFPGGTTTSFNVHPVWVTTTNPAVGSAVQSATNETPIKIQTNAHGLVTGDTIRLDGCVGNTAANGLWTVTRVDSNYFTLDGSVGNGTWTSGGYWMQRSANSIGTLEMKQVHRMVMVCTAGTVSYYLDGTLLGTGESPTIKMTSGAFAGVHNRGGTGALQLYVHRGNVAGFVA